MTRRINLTVVRTVLERRAYISTEVIGPAPDTDGLGEERWMVFRHADQIWRVKFVGWRECWQSPHLGPWEDPFPQGATEIECELVEQVYRAAR